MSIRTRTLPVLCLLSSISVLAGCTAFAVKEEVPGKPGTVRELSGVPFYSKRGRLEHTTVISRTWIEVTLQLEDLDPAGASSNTRKLEISIPEGLWDPLAAKTWLESRNPGSASKLGLLADDLLKSLGGGAASLLKPSDILLWSSITSISPGGLTEGFVSNSAVLVAEPDYENQLYFNAKTPAFGTASGTIKLAADGTLTEGTAAVDSSKIADVLPLKEFLSIALGVPIGAAAGAPPVARLVVKAQRQGYLYTLVRRLDPSGKRKQPILDFTKAESIKRSKIGAKSAKPKTETLASISATVTKPKP